MWNKRASMNCEKIEQGARQDCRGATPELAAYGKIVKSKRWRMSAPPKKSLGKFAKKRRRISGVHLRPKTHGLIVAVVHAKANYVQHPLLKEMLLLAGSAPPKQISFQINRWFNNVAWNSKYNTLVTLICFCGQPCAKNVLRLWGGKVALGMLTSVWKQSYQPKCNVYHYLARKFSRFSGNVHCISMFYVH